MGILYELKKMLLPIVIASSISACSPVTAPENSVSETIPTTVQTNTMNVSSNSILSKKNVLALITTHDPNSGAAGLETILDHNFAAFTNHEFTAYHVYGRDDFFECLRRYSNKHTINTLILAFHGFPSSLTISSNEYISSKNVFWLFKPYTNIFAKNATILLYSCETGEGQDSIAQALARVTHTKVIAPTTRIKTVSKLPPDTWRDEFTTDENGEIVFNVTNFFRYTYASTSNALPTNIIAAASYLSSSNLVVEPDLTVPLFREFE